MARPLWAELLPDWDVELIRAASTDELGGNLALTKCKSAIRKARVMIAPHPAGSSELESWGHEVTHIAWSPVTELLERTAAAIALEEPIAERFGIALARLPLADRAALARACADLPSTIRSRVVARARSTMDPKLVEMILAVGAMVEREDVPEDVRAKIKELAKMAAGAEPDGDEVAPPESVEPPPPADAREVDDVSASPPADDKPKGDDDAKYRTIKARAYADGYLAGRNEDAGAAAAASAKLRDTEIASAFNRAISDGRFRAGMIWEQVEVKGKRAKSYTPLARTLIDATGTPEELEKHLARHPRIAAASAATPDLARSAEVAAEVQSTGAPVAHISDAAARRAARMGVDAKELAAAVAAQMRRTGAQEG